MQQYTITVTEEFLEQMTHMFGPEYRKSWNPRKVAQRKTSEPRAYKHRAPRLSDNQYAAVSSEWTRAVEEPQKWRDRLAAIAGRYTGHTATGVFLAWGLDPKTGK